MILPKKTRYDNKNYYIKVSIFLIVVIYTLER